MKYCSKLEKLFMLDWFFSLLKRANPSFPNFIPDLLKIVWNLKLLHIPNFTSVRFLVWKVPIDFDMMKAVAGPGPWQRISTIFTWSIHLNLNIILKKVKTAKKCFPFCPKIQASKLCSKKDQTKIKYDLSWDRTCRHDKCLGIPQFRWLIQLLTNGLFLGILHC